MSTHHKRGHRRRNRPSRDPGSRRGPRREHIEELHPVDSPPEVDSFEEWDLGEEIQRAIRNMDISVPTPIQALAIGPVLEGKDVIAKAETGTGKTLAFGAPMMARIDPARSTVLGLVLCPTRELAQQVEGVISALALPRGVKVAFVVGGDPVGPQIAALQGGAQVVVGTPGRVLDLYQQRFLAFPWAEVVVLDEADKMFEIGFLDDIKKILSYFPDERQTLLFSATFPTEVLKLARSETQEPVEIATKKGAATVEAIAQKVLHLDEEERAIALTRFFEQSGPKDVFLVFCDRRTEVDRLLRRLDRLPFEIKALHGGYDQPSRYRVMSAFRTGEVKALLATDVASRGLDVEHVSHVVNYSVPRDSEDYTHRIGRTGRAGRTGTAITLVTPRDRRRWRQLVGHTKFEVEEIELPARHGRAADWDARPKRAPRTEPTDRRDERDAPDAAREEDDGRRATRSRERRRPRREDRRPDRTRDDEGQTREERVEREERPRRPDRERGRGARAESDRERPQRGERPQRSEPTEGEERPTRRRRPARAGERDAANATPTGFGAGTEPEPATERPSADHGEREPKRRPRRDRGRRRGSRDDAPSGDAKARGGGGESSQRGDAGRSGFGAGL